MKKILILLGIFLIMNITSSADSQNINNKNLSIEESIENERNKFKKDMLESILEFSDENTPADSLYIPDWIKEN